MYIFDHWSIFIMVTLSYDSNIFVILILVSIDYLFKFSLRSSCALCMTGDLQLKSRHFEYYVVKRWVIFKLSVLAGFFWHHSGRGKGLLPPCCHMEVEVQVPYWNLLIPKEGGSFLLLNLSLVLPMWPPLTPPQQGEGVPPCYHRWDYMPTFLTWSPWQWREEWIEEGLLAPSMDESPIPEFSLFCHHLGRDDVRKDLIIAWPG